MEEKVMQCECCKEWFRDGAVKEIFDKKICEDCYNFIRPLIANMGKEQIAEMQEHQQAMLIADGKIKELIKEIDGFPNLLIGAIRKRMYNKMYEQGDLGMLDQTSIDNILDDVLEICDKFKKEK